MMKETENEFAESLRGRKLYKGRLPGWSSDICEIGTSIDSNNRIKFPQRKFSWKVKRIFGVFRPKEGIFSKSGKFLVKWKQLEGNQIQKTVEGVVEPKFCFIKFVLEFSNKKKQNIPPINFGRWVVTININGLMRNTTEFFIEKGQSIEIKKTKNKLDSFPLTKTSHIDFIYLSNFIIKGLKFEFKITRNKDQVTMKKKNVSTKKPRNSLKIKWVLNDSISHVSAGMYIVSIKHQNIIVSKNFSLFSDVEFEPSPTKEQDESVFSNKFISPILISPKNRKPSRKRKKSTKKISKKILFSTFPITEKTEKLEYKENEKSTKKEILLTEKKKQKKEPNFSKNVFESFFSSVDSNKKKKMMNEKNDNQFFGVDPSQTISSQPKRDDQFFESSWDDDDFTKTKEIKKKDKQPVIDFFAPVHQIPSKEKRKSTDKVIMNSFLGFKSTPSISQQHEQFYQLPNNTNPFFDVETKLSSTNPFYHLTKTKNVQNNDNMIDKDFLSSLVSSNQKKEGKKELYKDSSGDSDFLKPSIDPAHSFFKEKIDFDKLKKQNEEKDDFFNIDPFLEDNTENKSEIMIEKEVPPKSNEEEEKVKIKKNDINKDYSDDFFNSDPFEEKKKDSKEEFSVENDDDFFKGDFFESNEKIGDKKGEKETENKSKEDKTADNKSKEEKTTDNKEGKRKTSSKKKKKSVKKSKKNKFVSKRQRKGKKKVAKTLIKNESESKKKKKNAPKHDVVLQQEIEIDTLDSFFQ